MFAGLSIACCCLLLSELRRVTPANLWVWAILIVFLTGYFTKNLRVVGYVNDPLLLREINPEWLFLDFTIQASAHRVMSVAFALFCLSSWIILGLRQRKWNEHAYLLGSAAPTPLSRRQISIMYSLLVICVISSLLLTFLREYFSLGGFGQVAQTLPFGLHIFILRGQSEFIPAILVMIAWTAARQNARRLEILATVALIFHYGMVTLITTSKTGAIYSIFTLLALWILTDRMSKQRMAIIAIGIVAALLFFSIQQQVRNTRIRTESGPINSLLAVLEAQNDGDLLSRLAEQSFRMTDRVIGAEGLWYVVNDDRLSQFNASRFSEIWNQGLIEYYTRVVVGVAWLEDFRSPGLVASFILLGGSTIGLALIPMYVIVVWLVWEFLFKLRISTAAIVVFAGHLVFFTSEGTMVYQTTIATLAAVILAEILYRRIVSTRSPRLLLA